VIEGFLLASLWMKLGTMENLSSKQAFRKSDDVDKMTRQLRTL
jgi:hypothetical protein